MTELADRAHLARYADGSYDLAEIRETLARATSISDAADYVDALNLGHSQLHALAADLSVDVDAHAGRMGVTVEIVDACVGARLAAQTGPGWSTPACTAEVDVTPAPELADQATLDATAADLQIDAGNVAYAEGLAYADELAALRSTSPDPEATRAAELAMRSFPDGMDATMSRAPVPRSMPKSTPKPHKVLGKSLGRGRR